MSETPNSHKDQSPFGEDQFVASDSSPEAIGEGLSPSEIELIPDANDNGMTDENAPTDQQMGFRDESPSDGAADSYDQSATDPAINESLLRGVGGSRRRNNDSITQGLTVLAMVSLMLLAARFVMPTIVEEIRYAWHRGELRAEYQSGKDGLRNVSLEALSDAYQMVTAVVGPSVVHIDVERSSWDDESEIAQQLFSGGMPPTDQGSGVVVDQDGYILTNRHVVLGGEVISVTLSDGRRKVVKIVGSDALTDLALLKIDADELLPITWGDSDRSKVGAPVWAVGSPFGLDRTITFGILSGKHRMVRASTQYQDFMQSDVAVNPGNSGGPLVNASGSLIGINTAIVGDTYRGVSFSIPSNVAKQVYLQLRATGKVERGWLGVKLDDVEYDPASSDDPLLRGAIVDYVIDSKSPAALAGMTEGDRIRAVNDEPIENMAHLMRVIGSTLVGSTVKIKVNRDGELIELPVTLGSRPGELNQQ